MKKLFAFIIIYVVVLLNCFAQKSLNYEITGKIFDKISKQPVEYATISLLNSDSVINGTIADKTGKFRLLVAEQGNYSVKIAFIGYLPQYFNNLQISENCNFKDIFLETDTFSLNEVNVKEYSTKTMVNKTVFDINNKFIKNAVTANDVLIKLPGIKIDYQNNISIEGQGGVLVLINGVPQENKNPLAGILPQTIEKVEIVSNPSVKYDTEKVTGIINIVLKKEKNTGFSGEFNLQLPYNFTYNESSVTLRYGFKNVQFNTNYMYYLRNFPVEISRVRKQFDTESVIIKSGKSKKWLETGHFVNSSVDFYINSKNRINISEKLDLDQMNRKTGFQTLGYVKDVENQNYSSEKTNHFNYIHSNTSLYYNHLFNKEGREITLDVNYYANKTKSENNYNFQYLLPVIDDFQRFENTYNNRNSVNLVLDYADVLNAKNQFNAGINYYYQFFSNTFENKVTNKFKFSESRKSAYINYVFNGEKLSIQSGLRTDYSDLEINKNVENTYFNVLPNVSVLYKITKTQSIKFDYKRTVQRPVMSDLNPFVYIADSFNTNYGNPYLKPSLKDIYAVKYSLNSDDNYFWIKPYYFYFKNQFNQITKVTGNGVAATTTINYGSGKQYGINAGGSYTFFQQLSFSTTLGLCKRFVQINNSTEFKEINRSGNSWNTDISLSWFPDKNWYFDISFSYESPYLSGQSEISPSGFTSFFVQRSVLENKGKVRLILLNPLRISEEKTVTTGFNFEENEVFKMHFQVYLVSFVYSFRTGKKINAKERNYYHDNN